MERNAKVESRASMRKAIHFESLRILKSSMQRDAPSKSSKKLRDIFDAAWKHYPKHTIRSTEG